MSTQSIKLQVISIDGVTLPTPTDYGFDLFDIVEPINTDAATGGSIVVVRNVKGNSQSDKSIGKTTYVVSEDPVAIEAKNPDMIFYSKVSRRNFVNNPSIFYSNVAFLYSRVSGNISTSNLISPLAACSFYYNEDGDPYNVYYEITSNIIPTLP